MGESMGALLIMKFVNAAASCSGSSGFKFFPRDRMFWGFSWYYSALLNTC